MKDHLLALRNNLRVVGGVGLLLLIGLGLLGRSALETRSRRLAVERATRDTAQQIANLEIRVASDREHRARIIRFDRGHGPGGIRSSWEDFLFHGPTAARSALELVLAAEGAGFDRLKYTGEDAGIIGSFPPGSEGDAMEEASTAGAIRGRIDFVEWPIHLSVESDWESLADLVGRITEAQPAFAVRALEIQVLRNGRGEVIDALSLDGELSTFWVRGEGGR